MNEESTKSLGYTHIAGFNTKEKQDFYPLIFNDLLAHDIKSFTETNPKDTILRIDANIISDNFHISNIIHYKEGVNNE